ncbi:hypothetical protein B7P43_G15230, partial [Cryptotermes secundus]
LHKRIISAVRRVEFISDRMSYITGRWCDITVLNVRAPTEEKEISNVNGVKVVNFGISKNLIVESTMFPHRNINKCTWTSPEGKTHNQIDYILRDRRRNLSILDVRLFRVADCHTDHCLVVANVREKLAVSKQTTQRVHIERFNVKKLNAVEGKEQYRVEIFGKLRHWG